MKRFDADCYFGCWPFHSGRCADMDAILSAHAAAGVKGGLVSSLQSIFYQDPLTAQNAMSASLKAGYGGVFSINPTLPGAIPMCEYALEKDHIRALRLTRCYHGYAWNDARVRALLAWAADRKTPVLLTLRLEDARLEYIVRPVMEDPVELAAALDSFIDAPLVLTNVYPEEIEQMKTSILRRKHTYVDTAYLKSPTECLEQVVSSLGSERVLFGSGYPLGTLRSGVTMLEHAALSESEKENIWWNNAARIFGLNE